MIWLRQCAVSVSPVSVSPADHCVLPASHQHLQHSIGLAMTTYTAQVYGWLQIGAHHGVFDYARRNNYPKGEVAVYTWQDASLRELTELVKEVGAFAVMLCGSCI